LIALVLGALCACGSSPPSGTTNGDTECRDTDTNELHCGACGHTCYGGACEAGKCRPAPFPGAGGSPNDAKTVVGNDNALVWGGERAVTMIFLDTYLPWVAQGRAAPDLRVPVEGGASHVATARGFAYWSDNAGLHRCSVIGCPDNTPPLLRPEVGSRPFNETFIAAHGNVLLFAPPAAAGQAEIRRCAADTCATPTTIYRAEPTLPIYEMKTDGTYVAFLEGTSLRACALDNCQSTAVTITTAIENLNTNGNDATVLAERPFALGEGKLAYTRDKKVFGCTLPNCTPVDLFDGVPGGLSFEGEHLYATIDDQIVRCSVAGCARRTEVVIEEKIRVLGRLYVGPRIIGFTANGGIGKVAR